MSSDEEPRYRIAGEFAMASPDLVHWYEKPDGVTMAEFCLDRRMREAQQLLLKGQLTIGCLHGCGHGGLGRAVNTVGDGRSKVGKLRRIKKMQRPPADAACERTGLQSA